MPQFGELPRHPLSVGGIVPFLCQPVGIADASSAEGGDGGRNQAENGNRKGALVPGGRRAIEEGRMPISTNRANFKRRWRRGCDPDRENANCHDHERHNRVHHNAERAMIGITADRMHVRNLGDGQKRQQDEAHHSYGPQSARL
jgi:hypothetical protein